MALAPSGHVALWVVTAGLGWTLLASDGWRPGSCRTGLGTENSLAQTARGIVNWKHVLKAKGPLTLIGSWCPPLGLSGIFGLWGQRKKTLGLDLAANQELLQKRAKLSSPSRQLRGAPMARSAPSSLFPQGAPELPVVAGDVQTLQGAQELVVAQPQVLEARGWVAAQTLHAAYLVAVQLQDLRPADRQPGSPGRTESAPSFSPGQLRRGAAKYSGLVSLCLPGLPSKDPGRGTSLVVQWLRLHTLSAGGPGSIPGQGTRSHMLLLRPSAAK